MDNTDRTTDAPPPDFWELGQAIDLRGPEADAFAVKLAQQDWGVRGYDAVIKRLGERRPDLLGYRRTRRFSRAVLDGHDVLTFWSIEYCWIGSGRSLPNDAKDGWLRPVGAPFRYGPPSLDIVLAGRGAREALRAWQDGTARGKRAHDLIVPADVWTPRIYQEAVRRFYMRLFDLPRVRLRARTMPEIRFENAWYLPEESNERAWAEARAKAEDAWLAGVELTRSGRRRFRRFGRDPGRPLG